MAFANMKAFTNMDKLKSFAADVMDNVTDIVAPEMTEEEEEEGPSAVTKPHPHP